MWDKQWVVAYFWKLLSVRVMRTPEFLLEEETVSVGRFLNKLPGPEAEVLREPVYIAEDK